MSEISGRYEIGGARRNVAVPRALAICAVIAGLVVIGFFANGLLHRFVSPPVEPDKSPPSQIQVRPPTAFEMPPDVTAPARAAPPAAPPVQALAPPPTKTVAERAMEAIGAKTDDARPVLMLADKDWYTIGEKGPGTAALKPAQPTEAERASVAFGHTPKAPDVQGSRATAVYDLMRTIRPGTRLFCTTQEAIDTTTGAGDFVCDVDNWVQAWDGVTPLIPPHSLITVHYDELKNGRNRVFAASGILTTPDGVVISMGDPFGMPDGSGGVEGVIQDNTWARLREGLILDFAQTLFQTAENLASRSNQGSNSSSLNLNVSTNNTQQAVDAELQKNMNIPNVLRLAQGSHVSMTIMHPIFMQDVVSFVMRAGAR